ncbi:hypothetical protein ACTOB_007080 [Actinoplanes oblitus]|uniref:Uncharacterized protein n=1 Tax=Actinoplanes oblitus TaxID=3040509 RepID=A0ABY8WAX8_9ACTN|nr:hypothetical protein [Actinoplanes oblitus]WIM95019.1 hypothetical protein ACTOB_007080 [Actinoplanes oblitus]
MIKKLHEYEGGSNSSGNDMMIGYTVPEIRRLFAALFIRRHQP